MALHQDTTQGTRQNKTEKKHSPFFSLAWPSRGRTNMRENLDQRTEQQANCANALPLPRLSQTLPTDQVRAIAKKGSSSKTPANVNANLARPSCFLNLRRCSSRNPNVRPNFTVDSVPVPHLASTASSASFSHPSSIGTSDPSRLSRRVSRSDTGDENVRIGGVRHAKAVCRGLQQLLQPAGFFAAEPKTLAVDGRKRVRTS